MNLYKTVVTALVAVSMMTMPVAMAQQDQWIQEVPNDQPVVTQPVQPQYYSGDPADNVPDPQDQGSNQSQPDDSMAVPPPTTTTSTKTTVSWDEKVVDQAVKAVQTQGVQPRVQGPLEHELKTYRRLSHSPRTRRQAHESAQRMNGILGRITNLEARMARLEAHDKLQDRQIGGLQKFVHGLDKSLHALTGNVSRLWSGHNSSLRQQKINNQTQAQGIAANAAAIGVTSILNFILGIFVIGIVVVLIANFLKEKKASRESREE